MNAVNEEVLFKGKFVVVTGATSGIGLRAAQEFCRRGAAVIGVGRNQQRCLDAEKQLLEQTPGVQVRYLLADLSRQAAIRHLATEIQQTLIDWHAGGLDILVNNAGTFVDKLRLTEDGIETTIAVNHLGPFLLTNLLLPQLTARPDARVITISSGSHYRTWLNPARLRKPLFYNSLWAYKVSKLANVLFTLEFNSRQKGQPPRAFAVDPGLVNTEIGHKGTGRLSSYIWSWRQKSAVDVSVPVQTILFVASDAEAARSSEIYWYLGKPLRSSRNALNPVTAKTLWQESARLCKLQDSE